MDGRGVISGERAIGSLVPPLQSASASAGGVTVRHELIGRESEFTVLGAALDDALGGRARSVVCLGEAGIGKTRLVEELCEVAHARGAATAWGWAAESDAAYGSWRQVLRSVDGVPALVEQHGLRPTLARLAPELFGQIPPASPGSGEERFRLFDAVSGLLRESARLRPLVVVLDDAHWLDQPSALLLQHVARSATGPLLLVVVARDIEQAGALLSGLRRMPLVRHIELGGFDAAAVHRHLAAVTGRSVGHSEALRIHTLTNGNPFFVEEVGRTLAAGSALPITATLREAVAGRLRRLSPGCARLLRAAAVAGRDFSVAVAAHMVREPVVTCLGLLDEAATAGLVEPGTGADRHRFVHPLVRDVVEAGLATPERIRLHHLAADAVERVHAGDLAPHLPQLARHWAVAGPVVDRHAAAGWIERAGTEAARRLGHEEAARLFALALDVGAGALDDLTRCRLLLARGRALHLSADVPGRLRASLDAAALARRAGRPDLLAEAALLLEGVGEARSDLAGRQLSAEAIEALGPTPTALLARVTARFAETCMYLADFSTAGPASESALRVAEQSGDPAAVRAALAARQLVCAGPDGAAERSRLAVRMLSLARAGDDVDGQLQALLWGVGAAFERGDLACVARELPPMAWCAEQASGPLARWQVLLTRAALAQAQARFDDVARLSAELAASTGVPLAAAARLGLLSAVGHHVGHDRTLGETLSAPGSASPAGSAHSPGVLDAVGPAFLLAAAGRLTEAEACYRSIGPVTAWRPRPHVALVCYVLAVDVAIALDRPEDLATLRELLGPYRGQHAVARAGTAIAFTLGPVELWRGRAAAHLGLLDDAVADLDAAAATCAAAGAVGFAVESRCELASVLAGRGHAGDAARARALAEDAARQAEALGMTPFATRSTALRERLDAAAAAPLTRREREVAQLVAGGLTNREIAARLHVSERTAQNHVQHILTKLDLPNRRRITAWVATRS